MNRANNETKEVSRKYNKQSSRYDLFVNFFNLFRPFGFDIPAWRLKAVQALDLKQGDTVVDIGCGTGLNFSLLHEVIGSDGKIIGVDLSEAMLDKARQRVADNNWKNVELVCTDATQFEYPDNLGGILSTLALILILDCGRVVSNGCQALAPGRSFSVMDVAWPARWSLRWRHLFFFMQSYGLTLEVLERRPWETIWQSMEAGLENYTRKRFWMGAMYLATGRKPQV